MADTWEDVLATYLAGGAAAGSVRFTVLLSVKRKVEIAKYSATAGEGSGKTRKETSAHLQPAAKRIAKTIFGLLRFSINKETTSLYQAEIRYSQGRFTTESVSLLIVLEPLPPNSSDDKGHRGFMRGDGADDAAAIIDDIQGSRRLVLSTAAMLIAQQDPRKFSNMAGMIAPLAILKVGGLLRIRKLADFARNFRRLKFRGLIKNRKLKDLTHSELTNAFSKIGLREAKNAHFFKRLQKRGPEFGINNLTDLERLMRRATPVMGRGKHAGTVQLRLPNGTAIITNTKGHLITFVPMR